MHTPNHQPARPHARRNAVAWAVLAAGLAVTAATGVLVKRRIDRDASVELGLTYDQVALKTEERLGAYALTLRGGAGLFAASESVERSEWRAYVEKLEAEDTLAGIQGIGFSKLIAPERLAEHVAAIRAEGFPDYDVRPAGRREVYSSIIYLEPFRDRNLRAFGYDMFSEPVRRAAMERARDTGEAALTGRVELVQETSTGVQAGTLMYVPVYRKDLPATTVDERRAALTGWVYSPYRMTNLMKGIIGDWSDRADANVELRVYDGDRPLEERLLFDSKPEAISRERSGFDQRRVVAFGGARWLLDFRHLGRPAVVNYTEVWSTAFAGVALSWLLFGLISSIANTRSNALRMSRRLTEEIRGREHALVEVSERLAIATRAGRVGVWDYDVVANTLTWDDQMFALTGIARDAFGGTYEAWHSAVFSEDSARIDGEIEAALRGEKDYDTEYRIRWPDGSLRTLRALALVKRDEAGKATRMVGTNWDITDLKQAEARAIDVADQLRAIFTLSPDAFVSFDGSRRVRYVSPAFAPLTGVERDEVVGLDETAFGEMLAEICTPTARFVGIDALRVKRVRDDGSVAGPGEARQRVELAGRGKRVLEVGIRDAEGETVSLVVYLRDVTHETEVDRLKSEFLATAAHELRTPMTSIYGFAELLLTRNFDEATRRELLTTIFHQSELMSRILNELLDLARIEARRGKDFTITTLDAAALVRDVVAGLKPPPGRSPPELASAPECIWVRGDRDKLSQALSNVLSNAYKYSPKGGAVRIAYIVPGSTDATSGEGAGREEIGIEISDEGIGMTPDQVSRVFERFYRADASGTIPGTGLGMSIVNEIVGLLGGHVTVKSTFGAGTTVTIWLPAASPSSNPRPRATLV